MPDTKPQPTLIIILGVLFHCPYCTKPITAHNRLSYPASAVGAFATVYRCPRCQRHIGAPVGRETED